MHKNKAKMDVGVRIETTIRFFHNMDITKKPIADENTFMLIKDFLTGNYIYDKEYPHYKRDYHIGILGILTFGIYPLADIFFEYTENPGIWAFNPFYMLPVASISIVMAFSSVLLLLIKQIIGIALSVPLTGLVTLGRTISFSSNNDINTSIDACISNVSSV